jgi:two-component system chemotaxis response regulator CheY
MNADDVHSSADDLFADPPKAPAVRMCGACKKEVPPGSEAQYCSACGAPLNAENQALVHVLLAEDAIISRRKIGAILKRLGCQVIEAVNGKEALRLARESKPDLIVLDVHMPEMGGMEALQQLHADARFRDTPIVMLTAEADSAVVRDAVTGGARDYIRKDSAPSDLQARLNKHVREVRAA